MTTANETPAPAAKKPIRVELWADIICPWCGLGNHRLEQAISRFEHAGEVEVIHRSFQLDERSPKDTTLSVAEMLQKKMGASPPQIQQMTKRIEDLARADGLTPYIVLENRVGNTQLAHELTAFAAERGKGHEAWQRLYKAYFGEARSIFDIDSLVKIAEEIGLSGGAAREALSTHVHAEKVQKEGRDARNLGSTGVPFFVINRRYAVAGAQPVEALLKSLSVAWAAWNDRDRAK